jgi:hypothetical protein
VPLKPCCQIEKHSISFADFLGGKMKILILTVFLFFSLAVDAQPLNDQQLKITGRALANYQLCADVAKTAQDQAMFNYYRDMYNDSLSAGKLLHIWQVQIIFNEQQKTANQLAQIDKEDMTQLCLSRFDALSRKMQEQKISE